jgi:hypothetical protein
LHQYDSETILKKLDDPSQSTEEVTDARFVPERHSCPRRAAGVRLAVVAGAGVRLLGAIV